MRVKTMTEMMLTVTTLVQAPEGHILYCYRQGAPLNLAPISRLSR
jgi:hypothetical protein